MGHNFADPIPLDDLPATVEARGSLAGASLTSKSQTTMMLPGVLPHFLTYMKSMFLIQFLELLAVSEKGGEQIVLLVCLLQRSLASRVLVQVLKL